MNTPTATIEVETLDRHGIVLKVDGKPTTYKQVHYMKDEFKQLLGDAQARVSIGVDERFSGPSGSYSSVSVRVNITLSCDQSQAKIDAATKMAFDYASGFLDGHAVPAMKLLNKHLETMYPQGND